MYKTEYKFGKLSSGLTREVCTETNLRDLFHLSSLHTYVCIVSPRYVK